MSDLIAVWNLFGQFKGFQGACTAFLLICAFAAVLWLIAEALGVNKTRRHHNVDRSSSGDGAFGWFSTDSGSSGDGGD